MASTLEKRIANIIQPAIAELGYELVLTRLIGSKKLQTLQIMAENPETGSLDLDGCSKISRSISALLDVEDPISGAYQLEVSSPGIDRPLTRVRDFEKHIGFVMTIESETPSEVGQKNFRGTLTAFNGDVATLETEQGTVSFDLSNIARAKLVLTDELVKSALKKRSEEV